MVVFLYLIFLFCSASAVSSCGGGGWVQSPATGRCYKFIDSMRVNWGTAQSKCSLYGGRLATLRTSDDMIFVNGYRVTRHGESTFCEIGTIKCSSIRLHLGRL